MAKSCQLIPYNLPSKIFDSTGNGGTDTVELKTLPAMYLNQVAHVTKFVQTADLTPTFTGGDPDVVGMNNALTMCNLFDGELLRTITGWNHLRFFEMYENGRLRLADPDTGTATTVARSIRRELSLGPTNFAGNPTDFAIPCASLRDAELRLQYGTFAQFAGGSAATVTALAGQVRTVAWLALLDEVRIAPAYERKYLSGTGGSLILQGRAAYDNIFMLTGPTFAAFGAGTVGNVQLDLGQGLVIPGIRARDLEAGYWSQKGSTEFTQVQGEPLNSSDDAVKIVNRGSPTAIVGATANIQPILASGPEQLISKLNVAQAGGQLLWDGTDTDVIVCTSRILSQPGAVVGKLVAKAFGNLPFNPGEPKVATLSKKEYIGDMTEFMPWKVPLTSKRA